MANPQKHDSDAGYEEDGCADAFAATAIIAVVVAVVTFWLHGMA
jgi:hypothetical protein